MRSSKKRSRGWPATGLADQRGGCQAGRHGSQIGATFCLSAWIEADFVRAVIFLDRCGLHKLIGEAGCVSHQVAHRDVAFGRNRFEFAGCSVPNLHVGELWQELGDGIVELEMSFLVTNHCRDGSDRFRHGVNAEDGIFRDGFARLDIHLSGAVEIRILAASMDHGGKSRQSVRGDLLFHPGRNLFQALAGNPKALRCH